MTSKHVLASAALLPMVATLTALAAPAQAAHHAHHCAETHAFGLAAPTHGAAGRHAWGAWIGSWKTADGQIVYHLDPGARGGRARYRPASPASSLRYHRKPVPAANSEQAAWILSRYGAVASPSQDAAVELAIDDLLVGGRYGLGGSITKTRLLRLDGPTRAGVLRLAGQMIHDAQQQIGPYVVHVAKAGASDATSTPIAVTVTSASGQSVRRAQVTVTGSSPVAGATGAHGEAAVVTVPRSAASEHLDVTATVPSTTLSVRAPAQHLLSRAAVAGVRSSVGASATLGPATAWTLTSQQYVQTVPMSDTRTYQTLYSGTFQDSWTCAPGSKATPCRDPAGEWCSHDVALNSGSWVDYTSVPAAGYRAGNTCVWRTFTATSSRVVQTGGALTPAQFGWVPASSTYPDAVQAQAALAACQSAASQRSCSLTDNASLS